jgi:hypothetical protein
LNPLPKIAFIFDEFVHGSPGQHLLDRFLIGYPKELGFHRPSVETISVYAASTRASHGLRERELEFGLTRASSMESALANASAVAVVMAMNASEQKARRSEVVAQALARAPAKARCFVYGPLANRFEEAKEIVSGISKRGGALVAGTALPLTCRLPEIELPLDTPLKEALIVVQGEFPEAEFLGVEGLLPILERRRGGESGLRRLQFLTGRSVFSAGDHGAWSWPLLSSALSRSNNPLGWSDLDGRTQDLVGTGQVKKLARAPRALLLEHQDGLQSAVLVLNGVVGDINFAAKTADGSLWSTQLYRPPPPMSHEFSKLAGALELFFMTGKEPWPARRNILEAGILGRLTAMRQQRIQSVSTPELVF